MTTKKNAPITGKMHATPKRSNISKGATASVLTQRTQSKSYSMNVTEKSGEVISRTVIMHREALKRLADR